MTDKPPRPSTIAAQGLGWTDMATGAVVFPTHRDDFYARSG